MKDVFLRIVSQFFLKERQLKSYAIFEPTT